MSTALEHLEAILAYRQRCEDEAIDFPEKVYVPAEDWDELITFLLEQAHWNTPTARFEIERGFRFADIDILQEARAQ